jgi:superfamily II DNA or RNA helicase
VQGKAGLREPQMGGVHAVLGYWATRSREPATVVMPTGTGKTDTMLAVMVAAQVERLLVVVPSDALRNQLAERFETLGVLPAVGVVTPFALRPVVGRMRHGLADEDIAKRFAEACNVIVTTPGALGASSPAAKLALASSCTHLFIDEAHHVAATTWTEIRDLFATKPVIQFTATPYREDGRHLVGRQFLPFPCAKLRAQATSRRSTTTQ